MLRVVLLADGDERVPLMARALELLGPKVIAYNTTEGYLVVRKVEADAIVKALQRHGFAAETRVLPPS